jgi:hypothetical protein
VTPLAVGNCFGGVSSRENWNIVGGATVAWVQVGVEGWCAGPGNQAIVSVNSWTFPSWVNFPYCLASQGDYHGPDGSYVGSNSTWAHGLHTGQVGVSYPWGCGGLKSFEAALRIAYNGYWDTYDDWGF